MLFPVASVFSGNATVKAIDKLPLFKQGDKENAQPKIHPLCWQAITYIPVMFRLGAIFHAAGMIWAQLSSDVLSPRLAPIFPHLGQIEWLISKRFEIIPEIQNRVFLRHIARLETRSSSQAKRPCSEKKHSVETADWPSPRCLLQIGCIHLNMALRRKVTACALMQVTSGENFPPPVPV